MIFLGFHNDYNVNLKPCKNSQQENTIVCTISHGEPRTLVFRLQICHADENGRRVGKAKNTQTTKSFYLTDGSVFMLHPDDEKWILSQCGTFFYRWKHGVPRCIEEGISVASVFRTCSSNFTAWVEEDSALLHLTKDHHQHLQKKPGFSGNMKEHEKKRLEEEYATWEDNYQACAERRPEYMRVKGVRLNRAIKKHCKRSNEWKT